MQEEASGVDGGEAGLAEAGLSAIVEDDVGGAVLLLVSCDGADGADCDRFGTDGLPVAGENVPLDWCEAEFAGYVEDGWAAGSVRWAEVADGGAECVFEDGVAVGEFLTNAGR